MSKIAQGGVRLVDETLGARPSMDLPPRRARFEIGSFPKSIFMRLLGLNPNTNLPPEESRG